MFYNGLQWKLHAAALCQCIVHCKLCLVRLFCCIRVYVALLFLITLFMNCLLFSMITLLLCYLWVIPYSVPNPDNLRDLPMMGWWMAGLWHKATSGYSTQYRLATVELCTISSDIPCPTEWQRKDVPLLFRDRPPEQWLHSGSPKAIKSDDRTRRFQPSNRCRSGCQQVRYAFLKPWEWCFHWFAFPNCLLNFFMVAILPEVTACLPTLEQSLGLYGPHRQFHFQTLIGCFDFQDAFFLIPPCWVVASKVSRVRLLV